MTGYIAPLNRLLGMLALFLVAGLGTAGTAYGAEAGHGGYHLPGTDQLIYSYLSAYKPQSQPNATSRTGSARFILLSSAPQCRNSHHWF